MTISKDFPSNSDRALVISGQKLSSIYGKPKGSVLTKGTDHLPFQNNELVGFSKNVNKNAITTETLEGCTLVVVEGDIGTYRHVNMLGNNDFSSQQVMNRKIIETYDTLGIDEEKYIFILTKKDYNPNNTQNVSATGISTRKSETDPWKHSYQTYDANNGTVGERTDFPKIQYKEFKKNNTSQTTEHSVSGKSEAIDKEAEEIDAVSNFFRG